MSFVHSLSNPDSHISTRRGDIFLVDGTGQEDSVAKFQLFASGLHEVLGLSYRDGWLYATQRCEVTRLKDEDGDGRADLFETVSDGWGINGDYHEYAFGSKFDRQGDLWVTLCLTGSFNANSLYRGCCLRLTPVGKTVLTCTGVRSPGGMGMNDAGDMFYTDNHGFTLTFTEPIDAGATSKLDAYKLSTYTYIYQSSYGSPEVDATTPKILSAKVAADRRSVRLVIEGLQIGHVHELHLPGVRSKAGLPILHPVAYYTLNELPAQ